MPKTPPSFLSQLSSGSSRAGARGSQAGGLGSLASPPSGLEDSLAPVTPELLQASEDIIDAVKRGEAESLAVLLQSVVRMA